MEVISKSGAYKAFYRFRHPEHRSITKWLSDEALPSRQDSQHVPDTNPRHAFMI
ncbi:hypothetical protein [Pseudomonas sp.]|uniref:hypothetical protein n=1 Tax=unclassified Pseudomonas TaxID=196821 RepID=UPI0031E2D565